MNKKELSRPIFDVISHVDTVIYIDETIEEALDRLRKKDIGNKIFYFYVVDWDQKLLGVVQTRKLLLSPPSTPVSKIMERSVFRLHLKQSLQEALEIFSDHNLLALPVVDNEGKLIGIIDVEIYMEESFDIASARHRRDVFQLLGLTIEEGKNVSIWSGYRLRMPWLFCNMIGGFICAFISRLHEGVLAKFLLLAMFIPLVLTLSESVSMQSMTQSLHFLHRARSSFRSMLSRVFFEWRLVILIAISCGFLVGAVSLFWGDGIGPSLTIGTGIMFSVTLSSFFGIMIPVTLHTTRLDPKLASGPIVLMIADVLTTFLYLSLAAWWLI